MPGQLIELTGGALAVLAFLIWIAVLSVRAVIRDHRHRTSCKQKAKYQAFLKRQAEVERKARQQL
ncbi:TPA: hypothetical protein ACVBYD_004641 [Yersinia enterocolitica]|uniref:Uncharacterized protein n=1 Tax=Yersinia kristensenii TaxID=28152 RepID=A0AB73NG42_YERKR|nr:hypothetical protein [Yersinia kristensenii]EKN3739184.1 hypothetical protein [Yersinia enterocolitica]OVZ75016.1 hypothetical protein CBW52_22675 [Yersinia kristensenii]